MPVNNIEIKMKTLAVMEKWTVLESPNLEEQEPMS